MSEIIDAIRNNGFTNPYYREVSVGLGTITMPTDAEYQALATAQFVAAGQPPPELLQIQNSYTAMTGAYNAIGDMVGHTNKLSGVNLNGNGTLATIAKTMGAARKINGELACSSMVAAFGSLAKVAELINDSNLATDRIKATLANTVANLVSNTTPLEQFKNKIASQIAADVAAQTAGQLAVTQNAIATAIVDLVDDPCLGQIILGVMNQEMTNAVNAEKVKLKDKIHKARYGY